MLGEAVKEEMIVLRSLYIGDHQSPIFNNAHRPPGLNMGPVPVRPLDYLYYIPWSSFV